MNWRCRGHSCWLLLWIFSAPLTSGFSCSKHDFDTSSRHQSTESLPKTPTHLYVSSIASERVASKPARGQKKVSEKKLNLAEEHKWLNWVYRQWSSCKVGELSEDVYKQMVPAISQWARRKESDAPIRAEELLNRIIDEYLTGNREAELTVSLFNAAMNAFAKIGDPAGVQRILRRMEALRIKHDDLRHLKPDAFSMSTLATAWAKSRSAEAATKAVNILNYMDLKNVTANTITYNAVLHALAVGDQADKALKAEDILNRMEERHKAGEDCKPDIYSYTACIQAWAKTTIPGSPQKAEQILRFLDRESERGNRGLSPNCYCFTTTISAWAKSSETGRARSAYELLQYMRKRYMENYSKKLKPTVATFTAVLNACSYPMYPSERDDSFQIAQLTMAELSLGLYDKPNFLSYAAFLAVCASCLDDGKFREKIVRKTFEECKSAGQVGQIVIRKLEEAASTELTEELVGIYRQDDGSFELPKLWTMCIEGERSSDPRANIGRMNKNDELHESSRIRMQEVQRYRGQSGIYSSGSAPMRLEADGIDWSVRPMGVL